MKNLKPLFLIIAFCLWSGATFAGLDEGKIAYKNGNYSSALTELLPLANSGDAEAQYILGRMHELGQGVMKDKDATIEWYYKSAAQNTPSTMLTLADAYASGQGVEKNLLFSGMLLLSAVEQKHPPAMYLFARTKVWFYDMDSKTLEEDFYRKFRKDPINEKKDDETLRREVHEAVSKGKIMVATMLMYAAENGGVKALEEREEVFSHMTEEELNAARERFDISQRDNVPPTFDWLDYDAPSITTQIHRALEVHP